MGVHAAAGCLRQTVADLAATGLDWPAAVPSLVSALGAVVGFDAWCAALLDPVARVPAAAVADNPVLSACQWRFWQIEMLVPDLNKGSQLAVSGDRVGVLSAATGGDLARSPRWDELLRPGGVGDELRVALVLDGNWWGSLTLYRERGARLFSQDDAALLAGLATPLARVARAAWTAPAGCQAGRDQPALNPPPAGPGTLVVAADGAVLATTPAAGEWLARFPPQLRASGSLIYALAARLQAAVGLAGSPDTVTALVRDARGRWVQFDAARLQGGGRSGTIAITVQAARPELITGLLVRAYAMTPRERQITSLALAGRSTAEIGAELFLSRHTVAGYLKAIFAKTRVHSRHGLAQRLAGLPAGPGSP